MIKLLTEFNETSIFSDLHLGHNKEFIWEKRGFSSATEHDNYMMKCLEPVDENSTTISLGDITYRCDQQQRIQLSVRMRMLAKARRFCCISGNHDLKFLNQEFHATMATHDVVRLGDMAMLRDSSNQLVVISHYPFLEWPGRFRGSLHLHGHCHGNLDPSLTTAGRMDCSVDCLMQIFGTPAVKVSSIIDYMRDRDANLA